MQCDYEFQIPDTTDHSLQIASRSISWLLEELLHRPTYLMRMQLREAGFAY